MNMRPGKSSMLPLLAAAAFTPQVVAAQDAPASPDQQFTAASGQSSGATSADIVVTASKRSESVQRIPGAITALSGEALANRGVADVKGLATQVPNITYGEQAGAGFISIRGVGTSIDTGLTEPSVAAYIDGVYLSRATMRILQQTDLERVEVLRGPQGTLYGRNATGGAINFVTIKPSTTFKGGITGKVGNFNDLALSGYLSGPLNDGGTILARISGGAERRDGTVKDLANDFPINDIRKWYGRAALRLLPSDSVTIDLTAQYERNKSSNSYQQVLEEIIPVGILVPPTTRITTVPNRMYTDERAVADAKTFIGSATINWDISDAVQARSITSYVNHKVDVHFDGDATDAPYIVVNLSRPANTFSQEFNLYGNVGGLKWLVGAYYFYENFFSALEPLLPLGIPGAAPPGTQSISRVRQRTRSFAAFVDLSFSLTDNLRLLGGLRYNYEKQKFNQEAIGFFIPGTGFVGVTDLPARNSTRKLLPKVGVEWNISPDVLTYATYQKGFKSGGLDGSTPNVLYLPELLDAYEVGFKSKIANGLAIFNAAAFYYEYNNYQVQKFFGISQNSIENADARIKGFEAELTVNPVDRLRLNIATTILSAKYTRFESVDTLDGLLHDLRGNYLNRSPKYTILAAAEYDVPLNVLGFDQVTLRGDIFRSGKSYIGSQNNPGDTVPAHSIGNLSAIFKSGDRYSLRAFVNNVGNAKVKQEIIYSATQGVYVGSYILPRTYGAEFSFNF